MIDLYEIVLPRELFLADDWQNLRGADSTSPSQRRKHKLKADSWMSRQHAVSYPDRLQLVVCPQKVLGHWNAVGSDDLRQLVINTAPAVLRKLGLHITEPLLRALTSGNYRIRELHIAHQFHLHDRCTNDFLNRFYRVINEDREAQKMRRGHGLYIYPRSRTVSYCLYNKHHEFLKRGRPRYQQLIIQQQDAWAKCFLAVERDVQERAAALGPRLEIRFGDHFFLRSGNQLSLGSNWEPNTAATLYREYLQRLELPRQVPATVARVRARKLKSQAYRTYLLWESGEPLDDIGLSAKTLYRHRQQVKAGIGVDMQLTPALALGSRRYVDPSKIFNWGNRVRRKNLGLDE